MDAATILIVDDEPTNLFLLTRLLRPGYRVRAANSGEHALRVANSAPVPDLVLLDVMMPGMDGYAVLARLRDDPATRHIPVVFLTALADDHDEEYGLQLGAADYITKPIKPALVLARVKTQIEAKRARDWLRDENTFLEAEVARRMAENERIQRVSIRALAQLAETRDTETGHHIERTQRYVRMLATQLSTHPRFADRLDPHAIDLLAKSAPLHDIGKVGIPDRILTKPGPLTPAEWDVMKTHARLGADAIERAMIDVDPPVDFLVQAREIARWHHERWDGGGYPDGLAGDAIPMSARIMALADVFDALISPRPYKRAFSCDEARRYIAAQRGAHFDPDAADAFLAHFDAYCAIARERFGEADETAA